MERRPNIDIHPKQAELAVIQRYAMQEGVAYDDVVGSMEVDPFDGFFDEYFEKRRERFIYGFISCYYPQMPKIDLEEGAFAFSDNFTEFKYRLGSHSELLGDKIASKELEDITLDNVSQFTAFLHGKCLGQAQLELEDGDVGDDIVTRLVYWSKIDTIARRAGQSKIPTLDFELD